MHEVSPPSATSPPGPVVCFDGDCGLCRASVELLARLGLVPRGRLAPFQSFDAKDAGRLLDAGVHNELAVMDPVTHEVRSGVDGLLWACEGSWVSGLLVLARPAPVRAVLRLAYRLVAYNRRILSPVRGGGIRCACDPDFHVGLRLGFIALALGASGLLGAFVLPRPLAFAAGQAVLLVAGLARSGQGRADALAHAAWVGWLAGLAGIPAAVAGGGALLGLSFAALLGSAWRRHAAVGLTKPAALGLAALASAAAIWVGTR
jgi:predicted DCC family thiol-disulfide oxidoreductase YuxK